MIGQCKLCLKEAAHLKDSHFISAGIYRALRDDNGKNPNPWMLTNRTSVQTSRQMTAHLLCLDCEQRFSKQGEDWVLRQCLKNDGTFPLSEILASKTPDMSSATTTTRVYYAAQIPEVDIFALVYFAASIFWRGSIHPWNDDGSIPVELGPFREQFRQYLMGGAPFPKDSVLWVAVREGGEVSRLTYTPFGRRQGNFRAYTFPMPGFAFTLLVGKNIPANHREKCFFRGTGNPLIVTSIIEKDLEDDAVKLLARAENLASKQ